MLKVKNLLDYKNLFSTKKYKNYDQMVLKYS